jgi:hypothetical protein
VTDAVRAQARRRPGGWVYAVDPAFDPDGSVPPYAIVGAWKVDDRGELTGEFEPNDTYRPTPLALGLPAPTDPVDRAVQLAATGHGSEDELVDAVLAADLWVRAGPGDGGDVVAFTAEAHLPDLTGADRWTQLPGDEVARSVPAGGHLALNPGGPASVRIPAASLHGRAG